MYRFATCLLAAALLSGCNTIDRRPGSENVRVVTPDMVGDCEFINKTTSTVMSRVGFIPRGELAMGTELEFLAQNVAVKNGGNTITADTPIENGSRTFSIYRCP